MSSPTMSRAEHSRRRAVIDGLLPDGPTTGRAFVLGYVRGLAELRRKVLGRSALTDTENLVGLIDAQEPPCEAEGASCGCGDGDDALSRTQAHTQALAQELVATRSRADDAEGKLTHIKVALGHVAVYEGMVDANPTVVMVDELVRDHEELEARIDAVLSLLTTPASPQTRNALAVEVARLLKGGTRVPDTIEGVRG